jgi:hypothetical protein
VDDRSTISLVVPGVGEYIVANNARFVWKSHGDASYRLTVAASDGSTLWSVNTTDTAVVMPLEKIPADATTMYWSVEALRSDGQSMSSSAQKVHVRFVR